METRIVIMFLFVVFVFGCKTTKQTALVHTSRSEFVKNNLKTKLNDSASVITSLNVSELISRIDSLVVEETIIEYSEPDSTGKQYPERVTTRKATSGKQINRQISTSRDSSYSASRSEVKSDNMETEVNIDENSEIKTKTGSRKWPYLGFILLPGVFYLLKRYGAFSWLRGVIRRIL